MDPTLFATDLLAVLSSIRLLFYVCMGFTFLVLFITNRQTALEATTATWDVLYFDRPGHSPGAGAFWSPSVVGVLRVRRDAKRKVPC